MRTNYKNHWMLAAILFCGLVMTSCSDQQGIIDNPVTPEPEQASAKDPGKWWIDENNMDKSVKPGDNFYMYCNGTWWKNTTVDPKSHITTRLDFMKPNFDDKVRSLTDANYAIFKSHLKWADPNSEAAASAQKLYDDVLKQSGLEEAKTSADVMRAYGFISQKTMVEYNIEINKDYERYNNDLNNLARTRGGDNTTPTTKTLSLKVLEQTMEHDYLPYLRSKMVADQLVPPGLKEEYQKYCDEMKDVFAQRIKNNDWLSDGSKKNALEKLDAMVFNVVYPDKWYTEGLADFTKSQSLLEDIYTMRKARLNLMKTLIGKSREEASFTACLTNYNMSLCVLNAHYNVNYNCMNMLPGYILPPFYDPAQSLAINYECFNTLGHEMTHGFDTDGSKFDKHGAVTADGIWASPADKAEFDRRTELLVKQFESYDVLPDEMPGVKANGKATIAENIADLGGMEIAWQAFINRLEADGYTGNELKLMKQRFFLAYAEEYRSKYDANYVNRLAFGNDYSEAVNGHSMNKERVNGVVANMDGWYDAFDIEEGALYRKPAERIHI